MDASVDGIDRMSTNLAHSVRIALGPWTRRLVTGSLLGAAGLCGAEGFPAEFDLTQLRPGNGGDGTAGVVLRGAAPGDQAGRVVALAGDLDGDGVDDVIVSDRQDAYIVFGSQASLDPVQSLADLRAQNGGDGSRGVVLTGLRNGIGVAGLGDVNGDGIDDVASSFPFSGVEGRAQGGQTFLIFGRGDGFDAEFDLASLSAENGGDGSDGVLIFGGYQDRTGFTVAAAGDVNGDGLDDLALTMEPSLPVPQVDKAYVVFGRAGGFPAELATFDLLAENGGDGAEGFALTSTMIDGTATRLGGRGDLNGDGLDDLVVTLEGVVYVVYGRTDGFAPEVDLDLLRVENGGDGSTGFTIGENVPLAAVTPDLNDDGIDDLLLSDGVATGYLVYGQPAFGAAFDVADLDPANGGDGSEGLVFTAITAEGRGITDLGAAGDLDRDGVADIAFAAPDRDGGTTAVVYAKAVTGATFDVSSLEAANGGDGANGFVIVGATAGDGAGASLQAGGDVNGDGADDLILGAAGVDSPGQGGDVGEAYVLFAPAPTVGTSVFEVDVRIAVCRNLTDPQTAIVTPADLGPDQRVNCEGAGLAVSSGDALQLFVLGTEATGALPRGTLAGITDATITCVNQVTGDLAQLTGVDGAWECPAEQILVRPGDDVLLRIDGQAD